MRSGNEPAKIGSSNRNGLMIGLIGSLLTTVVAVREDEARRISERTKAAVIDFKARGCKLGPRGR
jgi:hypothetical protein